MNKVYSRINWENEPSTKTPLNEHNLNKIDFAVDEIDNRVIELDSTKAKNTDLQTLSTRVDNLILNAGDSSAECTDARVTEDGTTYDTLKKRLDAEHSSVIEDISQLSDEINETITRGFHIVGEEVEEEYSDLDNIPIGTIITFSSLVGVAHAPNFKGYPYGTVITTNYSNNTSVGAIQIVVNPNSEIAVRMKWWSESNSYTSWKYVATDTTLNDYVGGAINIQDNTEEPYNDLNTIPSNKLIIYSNLTNVLNVPNGVVAGSVITISGSLNDTAGEIQLLIDLCGELHTRIRWYSTNTWQRWNHYVSSDCCFEKSGGASRYIKNVKVSGTFERLLISNIRNKYNGLTAINLFYADENGIPTTVLKQFNITELTGTIDEEIGNIKIRFDYDISSISNGSRIANDGLQYLIRLSCHQFSDTDSIKDMVSYTSIGTFERMGIVGDSYASGEIYLSEGGGDFYNVSWGQILARTNGMTCVNFSKGGLTTKSWLTNEKGLPLLLSTDAQQLYILALGINDVEKLGSSYLGTIDDITSDYTNNSDSFYGNYGRIIEQIKEHAPNSKIVISTTAKNTDTYLTYNTAIINIADHYNIPCIKQYEDDFFNSTFYLNNMVSGHPTALVYGGMAKAIERLFEKCVIDNIGYFADYVG